MKVQALLREKGRPLHAIAGGRSVADAIGLMAAQGAGALIVTENDRPAGIFTQRDVFRCFLKDRAAVLSEIPLRQAMTDQLITAAPEDDVERVVAVMIKADLRHLPVVEAGNIIALLNINDLIECQMDTLATEIHQLKDYIEDLHEAGRD